MKIEVPHNLDQNSALSKLKSFANQLLADHKDIIQDVTQTWTGNSGQFNMKAKGFNISGVINVLANKVIVESKLPMMLKPFQGQIETIIIDELKKLLQ